MQLMYFFLDASFASSILHFFNAREASLAICNLMQDSEYCSFTKIPFSNTKECNKFQYLDAEGQCVSRCPDGYYGIGVEELGRVCAPCSDAHGDCCWAKTKAKR